MITRADVAGRIVAYLNGETDLVALVQWAEDGMVRITESTVDGCDEGLLMRILGHIGAGDSADFPLTWEVLSSFLKELDTKVRVIVAAA